MAKTKTRCRYNGDKTRRARWLDCVHKSGVSRGAVAWAVALAQRSDALAKPVWGYQTGQAAEIHCTDRTVRRYRAELESAGLIETVRGKVERRPDGTIARTMTNLYRFVVAPLVRRRKASSHRPDINDRSNPSLTGHIQTFPERKPFNAAAIDDHPTDLPPPLANPVETGPSDSAPRSFVHNRINDLRATLGKK